MREFFSNFTIAVLAGGIDDSQTTIDLLAAYSDNMKDPADVGEYDAWIVDMAKVSPGFDANRECVRVTARGVNQLTIVRAQKGTVAVEHNETNHMYVIFHFPGADFMNALVYRPFYLRMILDNGVGSIESCRGFTEGNISISFANGEYTITDSDGNFTDEMTGLVNRYMKIIEADYVDANTWRVMPNSQADKLVYTIFLEE